MSQTREQKKAWYWKNRDAICARRRVKKPKTNVSPQATHYLIPIESEPQPKADPPKPKKPHNCAHQHRDANGRYRSSGSNDNEVLMLISDQIRLLIDMMLARFRGVSPQDLSTFEARARLLRESADRIKS